MNASKFPLYSIPSWNTMTCNSPVRSTPAVSPPAVSPPVSVQRIYVTFAVNEVYGAHFIVRAPFSRKFNFLLHRDIPARRTWDGEAKVRRIPLCFEEQLIAVLRESFPGAAITRS